ncbi:glycosyl hydrolase family 28-related protein [Paenibacillus mesophilus]|uniref:glycosyl hydrolase family 28-related protein n=1 Tax=Paenibacillus mesophilus TaxID=2582849 RepID=UPI00192E5C6B|nr:glycosyl hydrolase family 28-related protein [Paenibacillus mesophilus]
MTETNNEQQPAQPERKGAFKMFSRRELLASMGAAGITAAAGGIWQASASSPTTVQQSTYSVQQATYGLVNVKDYGAAGDGTSDDTAMIQAAIDACAGEGGGVVFLPPGVYKVTGTLRMKTAVTLEGVGVSAWDPFFTGRMKQPAPTELRFCGNGEKTNEIAYATDMLPSGGVLDNPEPLPNHADSQYKLTNFRNADATASSPATTRKFSVGIYFPKGCEYAAVRNLRIVPNFNGISGYNDTNTLALGDEWDVGVFLDNAQDIMLHNVQIVGYWRIAAKLQTVGSLGNEYKKAGSERNRFYDCLFQGMTGVCVRGGDTYRITAFGGTAGNYSIEIPWWSSCPVPSAGTVRLAGTYVNYTSTSVSGDKLTLHGIAANPDLVGNVGDGLRLSPFSTGFAGTTYVNCYIAGLEHASKRGATHNGLGLGVSKNIEASGDLRGLKFISCSVLGLEDILLHLHDANDIQFIGCYFESMGRYDGTLGGGRMIAAPYRNSSGARGAYPCGHTENVQFWATEFHVSVDKAPKFKRMSGVRYTDTGFFAPRYVFDSFETFPLTDERDFIIRGPKDQRIKLQNANGQTAMSITPGGNIELHGNLLDINGSFITDSNDGYELRVKNDAKLTISAAGDADFSGAVNPKSDKGGSLGGSAKRWTNVHVSDGVVMSTPDGTKTYKVYVDNDGVIKSVLL